LAQTNVIGGLLFVLLSGDMLMRAAAPQQHTVNLEAAADVRISWNNGQADTNFSKDDRLSSVAGMRCDECSLIRFDLSSIPENATLLSATMSLTFWGANNNGNNPSQNHFVAFDLAHDFDEATATHNQWAAGKRWAHPPFLTQFVDYDVLPWRSPPFVVPSNAAEYTASVNALDMVNLYREKGLKRVNLLITSPDGGYPYANFHSRRFADPKKRPHLVVVYSLTAPHLTMPTGFEDIRHWNHEPVSVRAMAELPNGSRARISWQWTISQPPPGSGLAVGQRFGTAPVASLTPDVPGNYVVQVTATNAATGELTRGSVTVHVGLYPEHPRLHLNAAEVIRIRRLMKADESAWQSFVHNTVANGYTDYFGNANSRALLSLITGNASYVADGWPQISKIIYKNGTDNSAGLATLADAVHSSDPHFLAYQGGPLTASIAVFYDWAYSWLTTDRKHDMVAWLNAANSFNVVQNVEASTAYFRNDGVGVAQGLAATAYATWEDNPKIAQIYGWFRSWWDQIVSGLAIQGLGGAMAEGNGYGTMTAGTIVDIADLAYYASGEDLFKSSPFFVNKLADDAFATWPRSDNPFSFFPGGPYPFKSQVGGDGNLGWSWTQLAIRPAGLQLARHFPDTWQAGVWNWVFRQRDIDSALVDYNRIIDVLYDTPRPRLTKPAALSYRDPSLGYVFIRQNWDSPDATWIAIWAGPHLDTHQHLDQGSFTLFKRRDLAPKTGDYSGTAVASADYAYYTRTISSNNILVGDPREAFNNFTQGYGCNHNGVGLGNITTLSHQNVCIPNDGGQRTMDPLSLQAGDADNYHANLSIYDVARITSFSDDGQVVKVVADITNAYNNPRHSTPENKPKVTKVYRRWVYLRSDDLLLVADTVASTDAAYPKKDLIHALDRIEVGGAVETVSSGEEIHTGVDQATILVDDKDPSDPNMKTYDLYNKYAALHIRTLFPRQFRYRKVGGRDPGKTPDGISGASSVHYKDFWVQDFSAGVIPNHVSSNWVPVGGKDAFAVAARAPVFQGGYGRWRLEVEPLIPSKTDYFLNVLAPSVNPAAQLPSMSAVETATHFGAKIQSRRGQVTVMFPKDTLEPPSVSYE
jgi:hypothetical protein